MKLTMIKVGMGGVRSRDAMEPLAFAVLASLTPETIELAFYDERVEDIPENFTSDWVIISANTFTIKRSYQLAAMCRQRGIKVAIGGFHTTILPDEAACYCDVVFVGDAEGVWPGFIDDISNGSHHPRYQCKDYPSLKRITYDERIFGDKRYHLVKPLQYSRGCRYSCDFCSIHAVYNKCLRYRDVITVVEEIKRRKLRYVFIVDDNLYLNKEKMMAFLDGIKPLKVKWVCQISMDVAMDDGLLEAMVGSGCIAVLIGFETTDPMNLIQMNKQSNIKQMDYETIVRRLKYYGLMIYGTFVLGYDNDTEEAFDITLAFALKHKFFVANFNPLIPTPGTALYQRLENEGRLLYDQWWLDEHYRYGDTVFQPKSMTPDALRDGCFRIRKEFNSYKHIGKRYFDGGQNLRRPVIYMGTNLIARKEILSKQGRSL